jgi:hypothetical protein
MSVHVVTIGEVDKPLQPTLLDANGAAVDITGGTVKAVFRVGSTRYERDMTIVGAGTAGTAKYQWTAADFLILNAKGDYPLQFVLTRGTSIDIFPTVLTGVTDAEVFDTLRVRAAL